MREAGKLEGSPRDIGNLMKEAQEDIQRECAEEIAAKLIAYAMPKIVRACVHGLPEWWKDELLKAQFNQEPAK